MGKHRLWRIGALIAILGTIGGLGCTIPQLLKVPEDFATIQAAINQAPSGSLILVGPGDYDEQLVITKSLTLYGSGSAQTRGARIQIGERALPAKGLLLVVDLSGFTFESGITAFGPATVAVHDNIISGTFGLTIEGPVQASIWGNAISGREAALWAMGSIRPIEAPASLNLRDNDLSGKGRVGVWIISRVQAQIQGNRISDKEIGLIIGGPEDHVLFYNSVSDNGDGVMLASDASVAMWENQITDNAGYGVALLQPQCYELPSPLPYHEGFRSFQGTVQGGGNEISGNRRGDLCPPDYPWPEGFIRGG